MQGSLASLGNGGLQWQDSCQDMTSGLPFGVEQQQQQKYGTCSEGLDMPQYVKAVRDNVQSQQTNCVLLIDKPADRMCTVYWQVKPTNPRIEKPCMA
jgi:hypothetical protein